MTVVKEALGIFLFLFQMAAALHGMTLLQLRQLKIRQSFPQ